MHLLIKRCIILFCSEYGESGNNVLNYRVLYERVVFLSIPY